MAFKREYYPSDTIKILNRSEGRAGTTGQAAHAMSTHLRNSAAGGRHVGVDRDTFARRWEANPYDDGNNLRINSGWLGKGDMAMLLCELLNSDYGGYGLEALDDGAARSVVHYYFKHGLDLFGNQFEGAVAEIRVLPNAPTFSYHNNHPSNPFRGQLKSIKVNPPTYKGVIRMKDVVGAVAVLDNLGGELHVQTFYPLFTVEGPPFAEFRRGTVTITVRTGGNGKAFRSISLG